ncbi:MAG: hypothetical protein ACREA0_19240 [bacterium]
MAEKNIKLADDVLALVKERAAAEGVPEDEIATEAVRIGLEERGWRLLLAKGRRYDQESGYTEDDVESIIQSLRAENRGR